MPQKNDRNAEPDNAEMHRFAVIMRRYLARRDLSISEGSRLLRISPRTLAYLISGECLPKGATLALIEGEIAKGAGCTVGEIAAAIAEDRAGRTRELVGSASYAHPQESDRRPGKLKRARREADGRGRK